jgi:anti-anti-sigma regulatory factor
MNADRPSHALTRVSCPPELAGLAAERLRTSPEWPAEGVRPLVVVDLSAVRSFDAAGIAALGALIGAARARGGDAALAGACPAMRAALRLAGLHRTTPLFEDVTCARHHLFARALDEIALDEWFALAAGQ